MTARPKNSAATLPPLRDDVLYDADLTAQYVNCSTPYWIKKRAAADLVPHVHVGRAYRWNAANIRSMVAGVLYKPGSCPVCRKARST